MMQELIGWLNILCNNARLFLILVIPFLASNPNLLCEKIIVVPEVNRQQNPLLTILDPIPVMGYH